MGWLSDLLNSLGIAYEHFIMRDLTYLFAGFIIIFIFDYTFEINLFNYFEFIKIEWLKYVIFLLFSYFPQIVSRLILPFRVRSGGSVRRRTPSVVLW